MAIERIETPLDKLMNDIGAFGKYQFYILLLISLSKFPIALNSFAIVFLNPKVKFECPSNPPANCPCPDPKYDTSTFPRTLGTEYNLICERKWMGGIHQTFFQLGTLSGSLAFGVVSDKYGRRFAILAAVALQIAAGFLSAFIKDFWAMTIMRMIVGMSVGGTIVVGFVVMMEFTGGKCRETIALLFHVPFVLGTVTVPLLAYFVRPYDEFLFALAIINCFQLVYIFLMPDTPRWLLTFHKTEKTIKTLETVAKWNNRPVEIVRPAVLAQESQIAPNAARGTLIDLMRSSVLRRNLLAMGFAWFASSFGFYGVYQYTGQMSGNVFLNVALGGILTLVGGLLGLPLMKYFGRKSLTIGPFIAGAVFLALTAVIPGVGGVVCACIGVSTNYFAFCVVYLWCAELFPTAVRNAALGFASMLARVGSMTAPLVVSLNDVAFWVPTAIFASIPLIASVITFFALPETKGLELISTLSEAERIGTK